MKYVLMKDLAKSLFSRGRFVPLTMQMKGYIYSLKIINNLMLKPHQRIIEPFVAMMCKVPGKDWLILTVAH